MMMTVAKAGKYGSAVGFVVTVSLVVFLVFVPTAHADNGPDPGGEGFQIVPRCSGIGEAERACGFCDLFRLINNIFVWLVAIGFVVGGVAIAWGGIKYIISRGNPDQTESAKNTIYNAVIGVVIAMASVLILSTVLQALGGDETRIGGDDFQLNESAVQVTCSTE